MNVLESAISLIAPHNCIVCAKPGNVLCESCAMLTLKHHPSRCYRCHKATKQSSTCQNCRRKTGISHVWVTSSYEEVAKKLVYKLKFDRAKASAKDIARSMQSYLPILPGGVVVTHLPTVNSRVRARGYDQAQVIARCLARQTNHEYQDLLLRKGATRQVGSSRMSRFKQLENAFSAKKPDEMSGAHILLVDDVLTTGASIESAAKELKNCGVKIVDTAVFAQP